MRHGWLVLVLLGACTDEVTIESNTCGNHVLEQGEDCDQPGATCTATCRFACVRDASDCTVAGNCCPAEMACGIDGACHAPTGTLSPSEVSAAFDVTEFRAVDLDGDGVSDVLGTSQGGVLARYGSIDAPLAALVSREAPFSNGENAFGDYNGDGHNDVLMPTAGGLFAFDTASGAPAPVAFPTSTDASMQPARIAAQGTVRIELAAAATPSMRAVKVAIDPAAAAQPCGATADVDAGLLRGRGIHPYVDGARTLVPMAFISGLTQTTVCVHASSGASVAGTLNRTIPPDGETLLAHLDSTTVACPALLVPYIDPQGDARTTIVLPAGTTGACTFPTSQVGALTPFGAAIDGYPLATIALANGKTGVITSSAVWTVDTTAAMPVKQVTESTRDWRYAVVGDFNGDGLQDFATGASGADAEAFIQRLDGGTVGWDAYRLVTGGGVYTLAAGDFDGDGFDDVALATVDPTNDRTGALSVAYGGPDGFTDPVAGPSFPEFTDVTTAPLVDNSVPAGLDHSLDLIVAHGGDGLSAADPGKLTDVFGSSDRQLLAPFAYDSTFGASTPIPAQGEAVAIGNFGSGATAVALFGHGKTLDATVVPLAWQTGAETFDALADNPFHATFKLDEATIFSTAYDAGELLVAVRPSSVVSGNTCQVLYYIAPATGAPIQSSEACTALLGSTMDTQLASVSAIRTIAGEGTANPRILVDRALPPKMFYATEWTLAISNGAPQLSSPIDYGTEVGAFLGPQGGTVTCSDATAAELGTRTVDGKTYGDGLDRVTACRVAPPMMMPTVVLFARFAAPDGSPPHYEQLVDTKLDLQVDLDAGDFNGDGLDDVVYTAGPPGFTSVHMHLQCDTHGGGCTAKAGS
jgi:hypothetical protein